MHRKRQLHRLKHPFHPYCFEAPLFGSWQPVEHIKIEAGTMSIDFINGHHMVMEKCPFADLRIRSRRATLSDCSRCLRPGIDICVLSTSENTNNSNKSNLEPVWADARISSIQRKPHDSECLCQFYVNFYVNQGCLGTEVKTLKKEIKQFGINQISILQRLGRNSGEDQHYRWDSSEDCSSIPETRLLLGNFLSDLTWLLVASVLKRVSFCIRSIENKIVYQILEGDKNSSSYNAVNFRVDNGMVTPTVVPVLPTNANNEGHENESHEDEASLSYNIEGLRRSKRRNVQPERYLGCDKGPELDVGFVRTRPYKVDIRKDDDDDDELFLPLSCLFSLKQNRQILKIESSQKVNKMNSCRPFKVYNRRAKALAVKSGDADKNENEHQDQLAIVPVPDETNPIALEDHHLEAKIPNNYSHECAKVSCLYHVLANSAEPQRKKINLLALQPYNSPAKLPDFENNLEKIDDISSRFYYNYGSSQKEHRKSVYGLEDMDMAPRWEGVNSKKGVKVRRRHTTYSRSRGFGDEKAKTYTARSLSAGAYKELIDSYLKNMDTTPSNEPAINDQWKQFKGGSNLEQKREKQICHGEDEEEISENDMLWREMEVSLASSYLHDDTEVSNAGAFSETVDESQWQCQHEYRLDEEIGIFCSRCGVVTTEIKDITPPFMQNAAWHQEEKQCNEEDPEPKADEDDCFHLFSTNDSLDEHIAEENDNVWALVPELKKKLHIHQKKAFEFLWRNIAGSMEPALMEANSKKTGGCVISHTPGAGKTFLIIAFLVSYLKLFPGKRPLVLAPKTTLYTWYKEFIKWEIPIPVYLIHGRRTYRVFKQKSMFFPGVPRPTDDVKHILDCLEKIQKWHAHPSVLVMGYTSFLTLMRENSKFSHRKYMAKVLRESPGMLVLDEGHNPRSTKSRLRKVLMKVETELRVLLSGTLFQNNFCEYFNTLCLARPKFAHEVLKELDPKYRRKKRGAKKAQHLIESRARKFFLDHIAKKIDSNIGKERRQGINMLKNLTNGFIDVYEGGSSDDLPGLQIYTLLMNMTDVQKLMLDRLQEKMAECKGYPLEIELLITLGSIHPWLVKTAVCANKFFTTKELGDLEKFKYVLQKGSKVRFVLSLVYRVVKKEKILIFCHNIAPVKLFAELFEKFFGWQRGREVLVLTGELELFERGRVMDRFEEPTGPSKILLASITACAEGISLTAASRVILLDSEWNPSKTKQAIARAFRPGQQKMVYVYQLLAAGTLEEQKYGRTTWKEWVSSMIFSEDFVEDPSRWQARKIEDDILRDMVEEDRSKAFHKIMKNEKASTN